MTSIATEDSTTIKEENNESTEVSKDDQEKQKQNVGDDHGGAAAQGDHDVTLHDVIETSHEQLPEKNAETLALEADFSSGVYKLRTYDEFQSINVSGGNFLKGVKWSPDGTCFLTCSEDNIMRIFETNQRASLILVTTRQVCQRGAAAVQISTTTQKCWYPRMTPLDSGTACFVTTSRDHPIQLWDAFTGKIRCSYRKYDQMDEIAAAYGLCFSASGEKIFCGYNGEIGCFYTNAPGRDYQKIIKFDRKSMSGYAAVFDESTGDHLANFTDPTKKMNGVTQLLYSRDGWSLFVGCRKSNEILCWDLRFPVDEPYLRLERNANTNQRIGFDIDGSGRYLISGNKDGSILVYDLHNNGQQSTPFPSQPDAVNGISVHPSLPLLAMSTGQRTFTIEDDDDDDVDITKNERTVASVWQFNASWKSLSPSHKK